jgi:alkylated DNA nucleotide flippase Atl1
LLRSDGLPKVEPIPPKLRERWGRGTVVIAAPREVDACMRAVRRGAVATLDAIRASLAAAHGATIACPITTGIFANYAAHAAEEARAEGSKDVTPWWRTLRADGEMPPKFPGAPQLQRTLLEAEGHTVVARGKRWFVVDGANASQAAARSLRHGTRADPARGFASGAKPTRSR